MLVVFVSCTKIQLIAQRPKASKQTSTMMRGLSLREGPRSSTRFAHSSCCIALSDVSVDPVAPLERCTATFQLKQHHTVPASCLHVCQPDSRSSDGTPGLRNTAMMPSAVWQGIYRCSGQSTGISRSHIARFCHLCRLCCTWSACPVTR